jgi:hypothetical protein
MQRKRVTVRAEWMGMARGMPYSFWVEVGRRAKGVRKGDRMKMMSVVEGVMASRRWKR